MAIAYVASTSNTSSLGSIPAGVQANDLLIAYSGNVNTAQPAPSGWTELRWVASGSNNYRYVHFKIAVASEPNATFTNATFVAIHAYRGCDVGQPISYVTTMASQSSPIGTHVINGPGQTLTNAQMVSPVGTIQRAGQMVQIGDAGGSVTAYPAAYTQRLNNGAVFCYDKAITTGAYASESFTVPAYNTVTTLVLAPTNTFSVPVIADFYADDSGGSFIYPDTACADQYAVFVGQQDASTNYSWTIPTGWTTFYNSQRLLIAGKLLTSADIGQSQYNTTTTGRENIHGLMPQPSTLSAGAYSWSITTVLGVNQSAPVIVNAVSSLYSGTGTLGYPSVTPTGSNQLIVAVSSLSDSNTTAKTFSDDARLTVAGKAGQADAVASQYSSQVYSWANPAVSATGTLTHSYTAATTTSLDVDATLVFQGPLAPPLAPTLTAPANASYSDLAANGGPFSWTFNPATSGDTQTAYAFRRKVSGAGSYEYWNAGTSAFQSTIVWNASTAGSVTFAGGVWTDGNVYNWSVANQGQAPQDYQGPFASDFTVSASAPPTVTVSAPTGTQVTQTPLVVWSDSTQSGLSESQTAYRVVVESGGYGTTPGSGTSQYDSGTVSSNALSLTVPVSLPNNVTYRAFVMVTVTGGQTSAWAYSTFTVAVDGPAVPTLAGSWDATNQRAVLAVQGRDNLLTTNQASLETDTTGWSGDSNTTIARSTAQYLDGVASLSLTAVAARSNPGVYAYTPSGASGVAVVAGQTYTAVASFLAASTAQSCQVFVYWYNSAGTLMSSAGGALVTDNSTGWTQATYTAQAPTGAVTAASAVQTSAASAASEVHYVDQISLAPGSSTTWTRGGLAGTGVAIVERSLDSGVTWAAIRQSGPTLPGPSQAVTVYDNEIPPNTTALYRARTQDVV